MINLPKRQTHPIINQRKGRRSPSRTPGSEPHGAALSHLEEPRAGQEEPSRVHAGRPSRAISSSAEEGARREGHRLIPREESAQMRLSCRPGSALTTSVLSPQNWCQLPASEPEAMQCLWRTACEPQTTHMIKRQAGNLGNLAICVLAAQSCPPLCDPMDCSPPGFSVHGILQTRILEWVAIPFSVRIDISSKKLK